MVIRPGEREKGRSSEGVNLCSWDKRVGGSAWREKGEPLPLLADKG